MSSLKNAHLTWRPGVFRAALLTLLLPVLFLLSSGEAMAQCSKDTDCKGDRICDNGKCVAPDAGLSNSEIDDMHAAAQAFGNKGTATSIPEPEPAPAEVSAPPASNQAYNAAPVQQQAQAPAEPPPAQDYGYPPPPPPPPPAQQGGYYGEGQQGYYQDQQGYNHSQQGYYQTQQGYHDPYQLREPVIRSPYRRPLSRGWAIPGGVLGIVFGGISLGLTAVSEDIREDDEAMIWGGAATVLFAIWTPLVAKAARSARNGDPRVRGLVGMRVLGWIAYGGTLANAIVLLSLGLAEVTPSEGHIIATGILGFASILCMSIDAFVSGAQAGRALREDRIRAMSHRRMVDADQKFLNRESKVEWSVTPIPVMNDNRLTGAGLGVVGVF